MTEETRPGPTSAQPSHVNVEPAPAASPASSEITVGTIDIASLIANSAEKAEKRRKAMLRHVLDNDDKRSRLPNRVAFRADPESMMDARFVDDLLSEARGQQGVFVSTDDPGAFEFALAETLRTEIGLLWEQIERAMNIVDPSRQVLVLFGTPIWLTEEDGEGKKLRKPYHLVRLKRQRAGIDRKGLRLDLPSKPTEVAPA